MFCRSNYVFSMKSTCFSWFSSNVCWFLPNSPMKSPGFFVESAHFCGFFSPVVVISPRTQVARTKRYCERGLEPTKPELIAYARRGASSADLPYFFLLLLLLLLPIGSMYAIYGNIYHQYTPNVSIYTIPGSYGLLLLLCIVNNHDWLTIINHDWPWLTIIHIR